MKQIKRYNRRQFVCAAGAGALLPLQAHANPFQELTWDDLIPAGTPQSEIIGPGTIDEQSDSWNPEYDANGQKLNTLLDGKRVKLPGFIIPIDTTSDGVTSFMLVPYVGACIHVPPPPPNQLVFVTTSNPWPSDALWDPVWVFGLLSAKPMTTQIADVGYQIAADRIEVYEW